VIEDSLQDISQQAAVRGAKAWGAIEQLFERHGLNANALTVLNYIDPETGGRFASPTRNSLRDALETSVRLYMQRNSFLGNWRTTKSRKTLQARRDMVIKTYAGLFDINLSQALLAHDDPAKGLRLDRELERNILPWMAELVAYLSKQLEALAPYEPAGNRNAVRGDDDDYLADLSEIWDQLESKLDTRWRRNFMTQAARAVFGGRAASKVDNWLRKNSDRI
jgi:hypothetical protein